MSDFEYFDDDGSPITLYRLVRKNPEWAASRITLGREQAAEIERLKADNDEIKRQKATAWLLVEETYARLKVLQGAFQIDDNGDGIMRWSPEVRQALYGGEVES